MISPGAAIVKALLRLYTYPYRRRYKSLSSSVRLKRNDYRPPAACRYYSVGLSGTRIEVIEPKEAEIRSETVQFHGGGCTQPMNNMYRKAAETLCVRAGCRVWSIDYGTGGGLVYPAVHDECYSAYTELLDKKLKGGQVTAIGDSFGANLMLSTCLRLRDEGIPLPRALVAVSCYIDLANTGASYIKNLYADPLYSPVRGADPAEAERRVRRRTPYIGETSPFNCLLSPAYADYDGFPDMLIQCGGCETSESDNDTLYRRAAAAGVNVRLTKYEGMWHDFQYLAPFLKESRIAWKEIAEFIASHAGK